ncbi:uncharacterized protein MELLADRAFT_67596 [Melampsora larici-populina 98AG31]|uniref:Uncharacterized protein n=1 Tax=Melampsora larici-populina (strain 98AG31 / pathotype 3-4-7) TaxID=747676 RepID=F4S3Q0_MELLP|nr:uncharacterized protein MELLADRAFT_67596 [Melampsora larici-populina 98AG31]EGG00758.1 hypothetical protein MELLADRAFT_67596 [Melampsora larici-populina 98AG31]
MDPPIDTPASQQLMLPPVGPAANEQLTIPPGEPPTNQPLIIPPANPIDLQLISRQLAAQHELIQKMQNDASARDEEYDLLSKKFDKISVKKSSTKRHSSVTTKIKPASSGARKSKVSPTKTPKRPSTSAKSTPKSTSKTSRRASAPPPKSSPVKRDPNQLDTLEVPEGFQKTKDCFYAFIRILWNMMEKGSIPVVPDPERLAEFNARFTEAAQITEVADSSTEQDLIPHNEIVTLADARSGRIKIGRGIVHVQDFFLCYSLAMLAKLGIRRWCPDLTDAPDSLWNEACRISAIRIFRMWVTGKAFPNASGQYLNNILLLERTYNHYVHYWIASKFKRETKENGSIQKEEERKAVQRARQRMRTFFPSFIQHWLTIASYLQLRDARFAHAVAHKFPKRYQEMLAMVEAHSNDEYRPKCGAYVVKTPGY